MKPYIKMKNKTKNIIKFGDIKIENEKFHQHKKPLSIKNTDNVKKVVSN